MKKSTKKCRAPRTTKVQAKRSGKPKQVICKEDAWEALDYERKKRSNLEGIAQEAFNGDVDCVLTMVESSAVAVEQSSISGPVRDYLLNCLWGIMSGETPNQAFGITKARSGAPKNYWKQIRDADIARAVAYHIEQGKSLDDAIGVVTEKQEYGFKGAGIVKRDSVEKAFKRFFKVGK